MANIRGRREREERGERGGGGKGEGGGMLDNRGDPSAVNKTVVRFDRIPVFFRRSVKGPHPEPYPTNTSLATLQVPFRPQETIRLIRDGELWMTTSTFTQPLNSGRDFKFSFPFCPQKP